MHVCHRLAFPDCTAFGAAVESPRYAAGVRAALERGEVIEVQGHRFRLCRSGDGWKIKSAPLWQMTHRQRFAHLMRFLRLGGDVVLWEARVRHFVKDLAISVVSQDDGASPLVLPRFSTAWLPPIPDGRSAFPGSRERGLQRRDMLLRNISPPATLFDGASELSDPVPARVTTALPLLDLRRLCPDIATALLGGRADLRGCNLRDSDLGQIDLHGADLTDAVLIRCSAVKANLGSTDLHGADLRHADLRGATLTGARFWGTRLEGAQLQDAVLDRADLYGQTLELTALAGATLHEAELTDARLVLADDALVRGATRRALLKPLHQRDGNLLWTVASLSEPERRREVMRDIVRALIRAVEQGEDVSDTHDAVAELLLKNVHEYWSDPRDVTADTTLNNWIQALARHQCIRLAKALPEPCEGVLLQLAERYRSLFAEFGAMGRWEVDLKLRSCIVSPA